jgi:hypothetical protein
MKLTDFHAKYFACELTRRFPSDRIGKLAGALIDAQVDFNPHQVEVAFFAFMSPLTQGFPDQVETPCRELFRIRRVLK